MDQVKIEFIGDLENEIMKRINGDHHWDPNDIHKLCLEIASETNLAFTVHSYDSLDKSPHWQHHDNVLVMQNLDAYGKWHLGKINSENLFCKSHKTIRTDFIVILVTVTFNGNKFSINFDYSSTLFVQAKQSKSQKRFLNMKKRVKWKFTDLFKKNSPPVQIVNNPVTRKRRRSETSSRSPPRTRSRSQTPVPSERLSNLPTSTFKDKKKSLASNKYSRLPKGQFSSSQSQDSSQEQRIVTPTSKKTKSSNTKPSTPSKKTKKANTKPSAPNKKTKKANTKPSAPNKKTKKANTKPTSASQPVSTKLPEIPICPSSATQPNDEPDDEPDVNDEFPDKYFFVYDDVLQKLLVRRKNSNHEVRVKHIADDEISTSCYMKKGSFPNEEQNDEEFIGNNFKASNIKEQMFVDNDRFRWVKMTEDYIEKTGSLTLKRLNEDLTGSNEIYLVVLVIHKQQWVPSGICICHSPCHHAMVFRTWRRNGNFSRSKGLYDGDELMRHFKSHNNQYRQARDANQQLQNQMNICQAVERIPYRFFSQEPVKDLIKLVGRMARRDVDFMDTITQMADRRKLRSNANKMHGAICEVSHSKYLSVCVNF